MIFINTLHGIGRKLIVILKLFKLKVMLAARHPIGEKGYKKEEEKEKV
jgi:hypothetical protein